MDHPSLLPLCNPPNCRQQFFPEHQSVIYLSPVIQGTPPPWLVERYFSQMCIISSIKIVCSLASQVSSLQLIRHQIFQEFVTCWARLRFTFCKTRNLSIFQRRCRTAVSSSARPWKKRRPTHLLGATYRQVVITANVIHMACHFWSSLTSPLRCAPSLECTQSPQTSLIR